MKNIISILIFLSAGTCIAQEQVLRNKADSLSHASRAKADLVLTNFDTIHTEKILYSISDKHYYVILKENGCCKEYYLHADTAGSITHQWRVKTSRKQKKLLRKAFNLHTYHTAFVTKVENASVVQGNPSYFVLKDVNGNRYGEYSLSTLTVPVPIDKKLYNYLLASLLRESTKSIKTR